MIDHKPLRHLTPLTAVVALMAGCGATSANTDTAFINRVNARCQAAQTTIQGLGQPTSNSKADIAAFLIRTEPVIQSQVAALRMITPPADKRADYSMVLDNLDRQTLLLGQAIATATANDTAAFERSLSEEQAISAQNDALAAKLGITDCATSNSSAVTTTTTATTTTT